MQKCKQEWSKTLQLYNLLVVTRGVLSSWQPVVVIDPSVTRPCPIWISTLVTHVTYSTFDNYAIMHLIDSVPVMSTSSFIFVMAFIIAHELSWTTVYKWNELVGSIFEYIALSHLTIWNTVWVYIFRVFFLSIGCYYFDWSSTILYSV